MTDRKAMAFVNRELRRAWDHVAPGLHRRGLLDARSSLGLVFAAQAFAQYRLLLQAQSRWPHDRQIHRALERARVTAREAAADFQLLRNGRLTVLSADGEDRELLRVFGAIA